MVHNFLIKVDGVFKNFLKIKETQKGDLIVAFRGKSDIIDLSSLKIEGKKIDTNRETISSITVHPNLNSKINSITINYKNIVNNVEKRQIAGILGVKNNMRLFPIISSVGRNISTSRLDYVNASKNSVLHELWPKVGIDLRKDSLAYSIIVANPITKYIIPDEFPRNVFFLKFKYFQLIFLYWLFNQPTKFRGITLTFSTPNNYINGFEWHEILNFTNDITLKHLQYYSLLPEL